MHVSQQIFSDIVTFGKYAKHIPALSRRETWGEICDRNSAMHIRKFPKLETVITNIYNDYVKTKKVLPSMRSMQFGGRAIELNNSRLFNCTYTPIDDILAFSETMFLLLGGSGVGYSVQQHHIATLPPITGPKTTRRRFLVGDSIEGWADAVKVLFKAYTEGKSDPDFDFRDIRVKGTPLKTAGGKAPGPEPLRLCLEQIRTILKGAQGRKLTSLEVHDIMCHIADAVLSGGIRRAAMIAFFSIDDLDMVTCKSGAWYELNPQRGRANNSVVLHRDEICESQFKALMLRVQESRAGEPGIYWTNDKEILSNPCARGDMTLLTSEGYQRMDSLVGKEFFNVNKDGQLSPGRVWSTGIKPTVEIRFMARTGRDSLFFTANHKFMLNDGTECLAENLKGKRLMPFFTVKAAPTVERDFKAGFILGDGCLGRLNSAEHAGMEVCIGKKDLEVGALFGVTSAGNHYQTQVRQIAIEYGLKAASTYDRELPAVVSDDFMMGLYSANGSVVESGKRVALKATSKGLAEQVVVWLKTRGMNAYITHNKPKSTTWANGTYVSKGSHDVNLSGLANLATFAEKVSFLHGYKRDALRRAILGSGLLVSKVVPAGDAEVFDFNEPTTHWGVINGVVAHNCVEATLRAFSFCNLTTVDVSEVKDQNDLNERVAAATVIGTIQASYTDFHYLRPIWKQTTEEDALIGVSMTGIGSGKVLSLNLAEAAEIVQRTNVFFAEVLGINVAARTSLGKPEGTASLVVGSSSGIHAYHDKYYLRRMRLHKNEPLYLYLAKTFPDMLEDCHFKPHLEAIVTVPQCAPAGSILRTEPYKDLLERVLRFNKEWIAPGHNRGVQKHNISCTVSLKDDEWESCADWMWEHRFEYNGISLLPFDGGSYIQAPFETCTAEEYTSRLANLKAIDLTQIKEDADGTGQRDEAACGGGACEVNFA